MTERLAVQELTRSRVSVRPVAVGVASAVVGGVAVDVPARLLMRLVALAAGEDTHFSLVGSVGIAVIFVLAMVPGAVLAAVTVRHRRWLLVAGAVFLLVPATGVAATELGSTGDFSAANWAGVVVAGLGVYGCIAALPLVTAALVRRWSP